MKAMLCALKVLLRDVGATTMVALPCLGATMLAGCFSCGTTERGNTN